MKTKTTFSLLILSFLMISFNSYAQRQDYSGEWNLNREKTTLADNQLFLSKMTIQIKGDSLITTRIYENGYGEEYPFDENLTLDGKDCKISIYDMPRSSNASFSDTDGTLNIQSKTTFYANGGEDDLVAKEIWKIDPDTKLLTMEFTNTISGTETKGINYYSKND